MEELIELEKEAFNNMLLVNANEFIVLIEKYNEYVSERIDINNKIKNEKIVDLKQIASLKNRYKAFNQTVEEYINGKTINNNLEVQHEMIDDQYEEKSSTMLAA